MKRLAALCLASLMIAACHPGTETNGPVLSYTDAFIMAPIGGRDVTMGGIEITPSGADVRLVAVSSDAAETVEMHTMAMEDGTMKMRPVESFEISDGETLDLDLCPKSQTIDTKGRPRRFGVRQRCVISRVHCAISRHVVQEN